MVPPCSRARAAHGGGDFLEIGADSWGSHHHHPRRRRGVVVDGDACRVADRELRPVLLVLLVCLWVPVLDERIEVSRTRSPPFNIRSSSVENFSVGILLQGMFQQTSKHLLKTGISQRTVVENHSMRFAISSVYGRTDSYESIGVKRPGWIWVSPGLVHKGTYLRDNRGDCLCTKLTELAGGPYNL